LAGLFCFHQARQLRDPILIMRSLFSSLPGLTRQSIAKKSGFKKMDHRVKPGDDDRVC
jgi:hypothetical protein